MKFNSRINLSNNNVIYNITFRGKYISYDLIFCYFEFIFYIYLDNFPAIFVLC